MFSQYAAPFIDTSVMHRVERENSRSIGLVSPAYDRGAHFFHFTRNIHCSRIVGAKH